jgi:hypothetical protein
MVMRMKTYFFKVKLKYAKRVWREIEISGGQTLDDLHLTIQRAFGFGADHLYSFFMSGKAWDNSDFEYYHPYSDVDSSASVEEEKMFSSVDREIKQVLKERKDIAPQEADKLLLLFQRRRPKPKLPANKVRIESLSLHSKQKFLYLFDYGDEWCFEVEFLKEGTEEEMFSPRIVDSRGKAPEQYPDNEDDLDDGEEEES